MLQRAICLPLIIILCFYVQRSLGTVSPSGQGTSECEFKGSSCSCTIGMVKNRKVVYNFPLRIFTSAQCYASYLQHACVRGTQICGDMLISCGQGSRTATDSFCDCFGEYVSCVTRLTRNCTNSLCASVISGINPTILAQANCPGTVNVLRAICPGAHLPLRTPVYPPAPKPVVSDIKPIATRAVPEKKEEAKSGVSPWVIVSISAFVVMLCCAIALAFLIYRSSKPGHRGYPPTDPPYAPNRW